MKYIFSSSERWYWWGKWLFARALSKANYRASLKCLRFQNTHSQNTRLKNKLPVVFLSRAEGPQSVAGCHAGLPTLRNFTAVLLGEAPQHLLGAWGTQSPSWAPVTLHPRGMLMECSSLGAWAGGLVKQVAHGLEDWACCQGTIGKPRGPPAGSKGVAGFSTALPWLSLCSGACSAPGNACQWLPLGKAPAHLPALAHGPCHRAARSCGARNADAQA